MLRKWSQKESWHHFHWAGCQPITFGYLSDLSLRRILARLCLHRPLLPPGGPGLDKVRVKPQAAEKCAAASIRNLYSNSLSVCIYGVILRPDSLGCTWYRVNFCQLCSMSRQWQPFFAIPENQKQSVPWNGSSNEFGLASLGYQAGWQTSSLLARVCVWFTNRFTYFIREFFPIYRMSFLFLRLFASATILKRFWTKFVSDQTGANIIFQRLMEKNWPIKTMRRLVFPFPFI